MQYIVSNVQQVYAIVPFNIIFKRKTEVPRVIRISVWHTRYIRAEVNCRDRKVGEFLNLKLRVPMEDNTCESETSQKYRMFIAQTTAKTETAKLNVPDRTKSVGDSISPAQKAHTNSHFVF